MEVKADVFYFLIKVKNKNENFVLFKVGYKSIIIDIKHKMTIFNLKKKT